MGPTNQLKFKPKWQLFLPLVWFRGELFEMRSPFTCVCSTITVQSCPIHSLLLRCCCGVEVKFRYRMGCTNADHMHVGRIIYLLTVYLFSGISAFIVCTLDSSWDQVVTERISHRTLSFYRKQYTNETMIDINWNTYKIANTFLLKYFYTKIAKYILKK